MPPTPLARSMLPLLAFTLLALASGSLSKSASDPSIPVSSPHNYTGIPNGWYSTEWQDYFLVTENLPGVAAGSTTRSFAGNIAVNRAGHADDTLFFWAFEKSNGSLTATDNTDEPWGIWLNGGPGGSSLNGLMVENGPLHINTDGNIYVNEWGWSNLLDTFWLDQPVGTGFATADQGGYPENEEQVAEDFMGFLTNLVLVFPSLAQRPMYLMGESYAGTFILYIMQNYVNNSNPPVNIKKISIGDGVITSTAGFEMLPVTQIIETYPQLINFDEDVYEYFKEQTHLCGYDINMSYPETNGNYAVLTQPYDMDGYGLGVTSPLALSGGEDKRIKEMKKEEKKIAAQLEGNGVRRRDGDEVEDASELELRARSSGRLDLGAYIHQRYIDLNGLDEEEGALDKRALVEERREERRLDWKRDLSGRANGTIDTWYGCYLLNELADYATNFSYPWTVSDDGESFNDHYIPITAGDNPNPTTFFNSPEVVAALHAPTDVAWQPLLSPYPWGSTTDKLPGSNPNGDTSVEPMAFLSDLTQSMVSKGISSVYYSGNNDALAAHRGTEVVIQNMTWGGTQGFTQKPSTPWFLSNGDMAGIVHQERNLTYAIILNAGHLVPQYAPEAAYIFLEEFILGSNGTGLVENGAFVESDSASVTQMVYEDVIPGTTVISYGAGGTASSTVVPSATWESWQQFLATGSSATYSASTSTSTKHSAAQRTAAMPAPQSMLVGMGLSALCAVVVPAVLLSFAS